MSGEAREVTGEEGRHMSGPNGIRVEVGLLLLWYWYMMSRKELGDQSFKNIDWPTAAELSKQLGTSSSGNKEVVTRNALDFYEAEKVVRIELRDGERAGRVVVVDPLRLMALVETYLSNRRYHRKKEQEKEERDRRKKEQEERNPPGQPPAGGNPQDRPT